MLQLVAFVTCIIFAAQAFAQDCQPSADFNCYIVKAAHAVVAERGKLGYSENPYMTRDYKYGASGLTIRANPNVKQAPSRSATHTSCNGAILEVLFTAINLYQKDNPGWNAIEHVPINAWNSLGLDHVRAHISMMNIHEMPPFEQMIAQGQKFEPDVSRAIYRTYDVRSVGHAFVKFGLGDLVSMNDLKPGDVVTFERRMHKIIYPEGKFKQSGGAMSEPIDDNIAWGSTHSVIFINWIDENQEPTDSLAKAKGFRYVSSQSLDQGSGIGYRWAYFNGFCPQDPNNTVKLKSDYPPNSGRKPNGHATYCADQRKQDIGNYSASFPKQIVGRKSDCCLFRHDARERGNGLIGGRIRAPSNWREYPAKQKIAAGELAELVRRAKYGSQAP